MGNSRIYSISGHLLGDYAVELGAGRREIKDVLDVVSPSRNPGSSDDARCVCHWLRVMWLSVKLAAARPGGALRVLTR